MMKNLISVFIIFFALNGIAQNVVIVIVDGARYTETFGDPTATYIPHMANLANEGTIINEFYNDSATYTSAAIPTIWCGTWTKNIDTTINGANTQYTEKPSLFEYFRKQKDMPDKQCIYTLNYVPSLWLPSFHDEYGPNYWPYKISEGNNDNQVLNNTLKALSDYHPQFMVAYFAGVDHYGHSGIWNDYVSAIKNADSCVNEIWNTLQNDTFYKDKTTLIVVNDHGRHDDQHGGFNGHGCSCNGCRKIMFLAVGPTIKKNFISAIPRRLPDVAVTAASLLDVNPEYATGTLANEILTTTHIINITKNNTYTLTSKDVIINKPFIKDLQIRVFRTNGAMVFYKSANDISSNRVRWNEELETGIYIVSITSGNQLYSQKIMVK